MHNYVYWLSRRIALNYIDYLNNEEICYRDERSERMYVFLDDLLSRVKRFGDIPTSRFSKEDVMLLHGIEFNEFQNSVSDDEKEEIYKRFPSEDVEMWSFALSEIPVNRGIDIRLNDMPEKIFGKCIFMRNIAPYSIEPPDPDRYLSAEEIRELDPEQLAAVIWQIEAYDITYHLYGLETDEYGQCYIKDADNANGYHTIPAKRTVNGFEKDLTPCRQLKENEISTEQKEPMENKEIYNNENR